MSDDERPFYSPTPAPRKERVAQLGECLFEFVREKKRYRVELRDHGEWEAQFFCDGHLNFRARGPVGHSPLPGLRVNGAQ
jgi:hypothetical protein